MIQIKEIDVSVPCSECEFAAKMDKFRGYKPARIWSASLEIDGVKLCYGCAADTHECSFDDNCEVCRAIS